MFRRLLGLQPAHENVEVDDLPRGPWPHIREIAAQEFSDVDELARRLGIEVDLQPYREDLAGTLNRYGDRWVIGVNRGHTLTRQRFTIAHEIGHFVLHPDLVSAREGLKLAADGTNYRQPDIAELHNPHLLPAHETQANRLAVQILLGEAKMRALIGEGLTPEQMAPLIGCSEATTRIRVQSLTDAD